MQHIADPNDAGIRIDLVVTRLCGASRSLVAKAIREGNVSVNGTPVRASYPVELGDTIDFAIELRPPLRALPEAIDITVVFEDDDILVVDKPAGMTTHPAHGTTSGTLVNALLSHVGTLPGDDVRPGLVHRLDRDTSGLLVVAKTERALSRLGIAMKAREISREYLGIVVGHPAPESGTLTGPIGRDLHQRLRYAIVSDGKPAVTHYATRQHFAKHSELLFRLETGRTHQIRVHLAAHGNAILNDPLYGRPEPALSLPGQALHAWRLAFEHPTSGIVLRFECDPPPEYLEARQHIAALS